MKGLLANLSLARPEGLFLLLLALPLVLLYILKIRKERRVVSSTWLWQMHERDMLARDPFRRLVAERSLLLQLGALLLLAIALAGPRWGNRPPPARTLGIVLDVSASMSASGNVQGESRLSLAKTRALQALKELPPGGQAFLVTAGSTPRFLSGLEQNAERLSTIVTQVAPTDEIGDLPVAVAAAAERIRNEPGARLFVLSDGQTPSDITVSGVDVESEVVGAPANNVALRAVQITRLAERRAEVFCVAEHHGEGVFEGFVTVRMSDRTLGSRKLSLRGESNESLTLAIDVPTEAIALEVHVAPADLEDKASDALASDSVQFVELPRTRRLTVVHAGPSHATWAARALAADTSIDVQQLSEAQLERVNIEPDALVVTEGICPDPAHAVGMDWLVFAPTGDTCADTQLKRSAKSSPLRVTSWEVTDPRLRFLTFDDVHIGESATAAISGARALVRSNQGALIFQGSDPSRTVTIVGFDPSKSDWPLRSSFVIFMRNVTELAKLHRERLHSGAQSIGEPIQVPLPRNVVEVSALAPNGSVQKLRAHDGILVATPPSKVGIYTYRWDAPTHGMTSVPVNLISTAESNLAQVPLKVHVERTESPPLTKRSETRAHWLFAILGLLLVLFEVSLFAQKPKVRSS